MQHAPIALFDLATQRGLIRVDLDRRIAAVLDSGRFVLGPEVVELEAALAAFAGAAHCVAVSSGTDALLIAMMAEGIGPGDAVFLPAFTYTATAEVPLLLGATPVFVDVDPATFNLDLADLAARIDQVVAEGRLRPRALIGVDLFGLPADWPALERICAQHGMFALDDAAQGFGGAIGNRRIGVWGHATALSFYPTKTLGCYGDGGALLTDDPERAELYRSLRTHGEGRGRYEVLRIGVNGRLDTLQAAVLLAKLPLFEGELAARAQHAGAYAAGLTGVVPTPAVPPGVTSAWGLFTIALANGAERAAVQAALGAAAIPFGVYYPRPLHHQPAYAAAHTAGFAAAPPPLPVAEGLCARVLSLPMHPYLAPGQVDRVVAAVRAGLGTRADLR